MANLKDVQDIMKYIEEITSKLQYSSFEVALLIADRSELTHQEITSELVEKVQELSDSYDSLFNEALNEDLDEIFRKSEKQAIKITSVEELQKYIEGKGWVISDCSFNEDIDWEISKHSPAGEDFCFNIQCSNAVEDAINAIAEYTNSFDEEEHIKMRLNAKDIDNNRLNVPSITELVEDAKNIKQMLTELSEGLESEPELDKEDFEPDICDGY
jgi:uncharacterized protein with HEPN domain